MSDRSLKSRQGEFCKLAIEKAEGRGWLTKHQCAKRIGIAPSLWIKISRCDLPDYSKMSERSVAGLVQSVTRICDALDLDLTTSLQLLDLPEIKPAIANARRNPAGEIDLGLEELQKLVELVKLTGQPIPMAFAVKFLRMSKDC